MDPAATISAYYESLRRGEPLAPYFVADPRTVKFGITERLTGYESIAEGLQSQTETTAEWRVESHRLTVGERPSYAWFADDVTMAWTDRTTGERHAYETRWSGTLERADDADEPDVRNERDERDEQDDDGTDGDAADADDADDADDEWRFVSMHVSRPGSLDRSESS